MDAIGERGFDGRTGLKRSQNDDGLNGRAGEFGGYVLANPDQTEHLDLQLLSGPFDDVEILAREGPQSQHQGLTGSGLPDDFCMDSN